ncbi:MAG: anti-sigma-D factor RsdA, partial [Mycobacterium sp.]
MPDFGRWTSNGGDPSLNEINRTDQFLDALASQEPAYPTDQGEAELANLLAGWRDDVRETPAAALVTTDEAARILERGSGGGRRRFSLAVVGSAAAAVLCIGGFGAIIGAVGPGDALYGLRTMFFGDQATRDDAVILAAQTEMAQVQELIDQGDWQAAQDKLETVTTTVATVNDFERKEELVTQWQELTVKVEAQDAAATVAPGAPLPTF